MAVHQWTDVVVFDPCRIPYSLPKQISKFTVLQDLVARVP